MIVSAQSAHNIFKNKRKSCEEVKNANFIPLSVLDAQQYLKAQEKLIKQGKSTMLEDSHLKYK